MDDAEFKDPLEGDLGEELPSEDDLDLALAADKKKKDLIDEEEVVSSDDLEEEELAEDDEPFDDVYEN